MTVPLMTVFHHWKHSREAQNMVHMTSTRQIHSAAGINPEREMDYFKTLALHPNTTIKHGCGTQFLSQISSTEHSLNFKTHLTPIIVTRIA